MSSLRRTERVDEWPVLRAERAETLSPRAALGLIVLATDRVSERDFRDFTACPGVEAFATRVPFAAVANEATLAAIEPHLAQAGDLLVPGFPLASIGFSCTSGTIAIGPDRVRRALAGVRPGVPVATPVEGAVAGLRHLGCRSISLVTPYRVPTAALVARYFEENGIEIRAKATFDLDGDPDINRVTEEAMVEAVNAVFDPSSDAVFISCTGLRTAPLVARLERSVGKPVLTSNQALAWQALRSAGVGDAVANRGRLLAA